MEAKKRTLNSQCIYNEYIALEKSLLADGIKRGAMSELARKYNCTYCTIKYHVRKITKEMELDETRWMDEFEAVRQELLNSAKVVKEVKKNIIRIIPASKIPRGFIY